MRASPHLRAFGAELWRSDKLRQMAEDRLAQQHLRVCWQIDPGPSRNCGRCEKYVRTMLVPCTTGGLEDFTTFERGPPLATRAAALPPIGDHLLPIHRGQS